MVFTRSRTSPPQPLRLRQAGRRQTRLDTRLNAQFTQTKSIATMNRAVSNKRKYREYSNDDDDDDGGDDDDGEEEDEEDEEEKKEEYPKSPRYITTTSPRKRKIPYIVLDDSDNEVEAVGSELSTVKMRSTEPAEDPSESLASVLFKSFPTELHQLVIAHLSSDRDVCNYGLISKESKQAVNDNFVLRERSKYIFDEQGDESVEEIAVRYKHRREISKRLVFFDLRKFGNRIDRAAEYYQWQSQKDTLDLFRELILESSAKTIMNERGNAVIEGRNIEYIRNMLNGWNGHPQIDIIEAVFNTSEKGWRRKGIRDVVAASMADTLIYVVQLCLSSFSLDPNQCRKRICHFATSQFMAYEPGNYQPMFIGRYKQDLNVRLLLNVINFFKFHLKTEGEGILAHHFGDLAVDQYPQPWAGLIQPETQPLGSHWKGAYMYMDAKTLRSLRSWNPDSTEFHLDCLDGNEAFQDISIFFDEGEFSAKNWPRSWEEVLSSNPFKESNTGNKNPPSPRPPRKTVPKSEIKEFWGTCRGSKNGHYFGRVHAVTAQQGIHGFQRITMIQFYTKAVNGAQVYDETQVWAYEGCVLPGGSIIVGRWWDPRDEVTDDSCTSGPFIWWNVSRSEATPEITPTEAITFMDTVDAEFVWRE